MSMFDWFVLVGICLFVLILTGISGAVAALIELQEVSEEASDRLLRGEAPSSRQCPPSTASAPNLTPIGTTAGERSRFKTTPA